MKKASTPDRSRSDLLSSAMIAMFLAGRAATRAEADAHHLDYEGFMASAHAAPWRLPILRIVR